MTKALIVPEETPATIAGRKELHERQDRIYEHMDGSSCEFEAIRDRKLFEFDGYKSWGDYCQQFWGQSKSTIDRIIRKERLIENVAQVVPKGTVITKAVADELSDLPPEDQKKAAAQLPKNTLRPTPADAKNGRAAAGLPPKPSRPNRKEDKRTAVSNYFAAKGSQMPQNASGSGTSRLPSQGVQEPGRVVPSGGAMEEWLAALSRLCREFGLMFAESASFPGLKDHKEHIAETLRTMAAAIPDSISWNEEIKPVPGDVDKAVAAVKRITTDAARWTDSDAVARLADELVRAAAILAPENGESDSKLLTVTEEMELVVQTWNAAGQIKCIQLTPKRKKTLRDRLKDKFWRDNWREAIAKAEKIPAIKASGCDFDWFLRPDKVVRLVEGKYDGWTIGKGEPLNRTLDKDFGQSGRL